MKVGCPEELLFDLVEGEEHREVALADGALSYAVASCRSGPCAGTIVLIHGVGSNASRWEEFTEQTPLREGWRIIRLDLRGHGASESREKATLEIHAADLMRVLDDAGIEKAVLVGHSLGAQIAMRAAVLYPDRIQGMVLMDPLVTSALTPSALAHRRKYPPEAATPCRPSSTNTRPRSRTSATFTPPATCATFSKWAAKRLISPASGSPCW